MDLDEAIATLDLFSDYTFKDSEDKPHFCIYDDQNEGYIIKLKAVSLSQEYRNYLEEKAEARKLVLWESKGYVTIHGL